jgi:hypothetical protein
MFSNVNIVFSPAMEYFKVYSLYPYGLPRFDYVSARNDRDGICHCEERSDVAIPIPVFIISR